MLLKSVVMLLDLLKVEVRFKLLNAPPFLALKAIPFPKLINTGSVKTPDPSKLRLLSVKISPKWQQNSLLRFGLRLEIKEQSKISNEELILSNLNKASTTSA